MSGDTPETAIIGDAQSNRAQSKSVLTEDVVAGLLADVAGVDEVLEHHEPILHERRHVRVAEQPGPRARLLARRLARLLARRLARLLT